MLPLLGIAPHVLYIYFSPHVRFALLQNLSPFEMPALSVKWIQQHKYIHDCLAPEQEKTQASKPVKSEHVRGFTMLA
jgi:hypothetical protein